MSLAIDKTCYIVCRNLISHTRLIYYRFVSPTEILGFGKFFLTSPKNIKKPSQVRALEELKIVF
jgi:hypothetical protein